MRGKITQLEGGEIGVNGLITAILVTGELNDTAHDRHMVRGLCEIIGNIKMRGGRFRW